MIAGCFAKPIREDSLQQTIEDIHWDLCRSEEAQAVEPFLDNRGFQLRHLQLLEMVENRSNQCYLIELKVLSDTSSTEVSLF